MTFAYIWEYRINTEHAKAFEAAYGQEGGWVRLFRRDPAYIRTELLSDSSDPEHFITIDYWTMRQACFAFRERFQAEFDAIDKHCARFTPEERHRGDFNLID